MKARIALALILFAFGACKEKRLPKKPADQTDGRAKASSGYSAKSTQDGTFVETPNLNAEQMVSTLSATVVAGALPPKTYTAAMLHRDETLPLSLGSKNRCVLALLKGWTDDQLTNSSTRIHLVRNQPDETAGGYSSTSFRGTVLQFDPASGLAAIFYTDQLDAKLDVGYKISRSGKVPGSLSLLRAVTQTASRSPDARRGVARLGPRDPAERAQLNFSVTAWMPATAPTPPSYDGSDGSKNPILVSKPATLEGFVAETEDKKSEIVLPQQFKIEVGTVQLTPKSIAFGRAQTTYLPFAVTVERNIPSKKPVRVQLAAVQQTTGAIPKLSEFKEPFYPPGEPEVVNLHASQEPGKFHGNLPLSTGDGAYVFLAHLAWPAIQALPSGPTYSRPFLIRVERKDGVVKASVEGLETAIDPGAVVPDTVSDFAFESPAKDVQEIAEGGEILFQLAGKPYWKRFSVRKREWLPLPSVDLANCDITGNRNALFVLDKGGAEVRKFAIDDLRLLHSAKLPTGQQYVAIRSGPLTERAPIHIITSGAPLSLRPDTLERADIPTYGARESLFPRLEHGQRLIATGDGHAVGIYAHGAADRPAYYWGDSRGLTRFGAKLGGCTGVSPGYEINSNYGLGTTLTEDGRPLHVQIPRPVGESGNQIWLMQSSPILVRFLGGKEGIPPLPARLECRGYFHSNPFATTPVADVTRTTQGGWEHNARPFHVTFDGGSMRLGVVAPDAKRFQIHQLLPVKELPQPVLLNWPDSCVRRGTSFEFKPVTLNGSAWTAELHGGGPSTALRVTDQNISLSVGADEPAMLMLIVLKLSGSGGEALYRIPVHVSGPEPVVAAATDIPEERLRDIGTTLATRSLPTDRVRSLDPYFHASSSQIVSVQGPVAGHLLFVNRDPRVDIYSLKDRKVIRSLPAGARASYYAAADVLFEYDAANRTLTRIMIPSGQRARSLTLPGGLMLVSFGCGMARNSPLTIVVERRDDVQTRDFADGTLTTWKSGRNLMVLNSETLSAEGIAQPKLAPWPENQQLDINQATFFLSGKDGHPSQMPSSRAGNIVFMPKGFVVTVPNYGLISPYPGFRANHYIAFGSGFMLGSLTGVSFSSYSTLYKFGERNEPPGGRGQAEVSSCGRYRLRRNSADDRQILEVQSADDEMVLFRLARVVNAPGPFAEQVTGRSVEYLGEGGPLLIRSAAGRLLEFVDVDISRLAASLEPSRFHVISQPQPLVMEGGVWEYQVQTNNPTAVESYSLRTPTPGASISPAGLARFTAPRGVTAATRINLSIEIKSKENSTILHEFPIIVLPTKVPPVVQSTRPPSTQPKQSLPGSPPTPL